MILAIRKRKFVSTSIAVLMSALMLLPLNGYTASKQSDSAGQPLSGMHHVDPFTGNFSYNIHLFDFEGLPISLQYSGNQNMYSEASWVGLGWELNLGKIERYKRGIPDDFKGDEVVREASFMPDNSAGINTGFGVRARFSYPIPPAFSVGSVFFKEQYKGHFVNTRTGLGFSSYSGIHISGSGSIGIGDYLYAGVNQNIGSHTYYNSSTGYTINSSAGIGAGAGASFIVNLASASTSMQYGKTYQSRSDKVRKHRSFGYGSKLPWELHNENISLQKTPLYDKIEGIPAFSFPSLYNTLRHTIKGDGSGSSFTFYAPDFYHYGLKETYLMQQIMSEKKISQPAYGYMYLHESGKSQEELVDVSAGNSIKISEYAAFLPFPYLQNDVFMATGSAFSGAMRVYRNDVGLSEDFPSKMMDINSGTTEEKAHGLFYLKSTGSDHSLAIAQSGGSTEAMDNIRHLLSRKGAQENTDYEAFYMKLKTENTAYNNKLYKKYGSEKPAYVRLSDNTETVKAEANLIVQNLHNNNTMQIAMPQNNTEEARSPRSTHIRVFDAKKASSHGYAKNIEHYPFLSKSNYDSEAYIKRELSRQSSYRKPHHISELSLTDIGGSRFVYGIPVYTVQDKHVHFSVSGNGHQPKASGAVIGFRAGIDNSQQNSCGRDRSYHATHTPAYANSFLLSYILSPGYIDLSGDGPSDDDIGNYVKINYSIAPISHTARTPKAKTYPSAFFHEEAYSDDMDNTASYAYTEEEQWYPQTLESKNYIAEFYLSDRRDGHGPSSENSHIDYSYSQKKKLDEIRIYVKSERHKHGNAAIPLKTIHFEYDYSLCKQYPGYYKADNPSEKLGKLTLKKVWATYGRSQSGANNPFRFAYEGSNRNYEYGKTNMWEQYVAQGSATQTMVETPWLCPNNAAYDADSWSWDLTRIVAPAGGELLIEYEADDYAYVQEKPVANMFQVKKISRYSFSNFLSSNSLYYNDNETDYEKPAIFIYIENSDSLSKALLRAGKSVEAINRVKEVYTAANTTNELAQVFFKVYANVRNSAQETNAFDYISGYADIKDITLDLPSLGELFVIELYPVRETVEKPKIDVSPICKAVWQYAREAVPQILWKTTSPEIISDVEEEIRKNKRTGINRILRLHNYGRYFVPERSYVKLYEPSKKKKGGGNRVKSIRISDNWQHMSEGVSAWYGKTYEYSIEENGYSISSGVAASEPYSGREASPLTYARNYDYKQKDIVEVQEFPHAEGMFPAPVVGYRRVKERDIFGKDAEPCSSGYIEYAYHTAKDFPTAVHQTIVHAKTISLSEVRDKSKSTYRNDITGLSQGYSVIRNDMHGRIKHINVYGETDTQPLLASTTYYYKTDAKNRLINETQAASNKSIKAENQRVGVYTDICFHHKRYARAGLMFAQSSSSEYGIGSTLFGVSLQQNLTMHQEQASLFSIVCSKVTMTTALLDSVVTISEGVRQKQKSDIVDAHTGMALITHSTLSYNQPLYHFTYPLHWMQQIAEPAWISSGFIATGCSPAGNRLQLPPAVKADSIFVPGDYLMVKTAGNYQEAWTAKVFPENNQLLLIDRQGNILTFSQNLSLEIVIPGRKNLLNLSCGNIQSISMPLMFNTTIPSGTQMINAPNIIHANATCYSEQKLTTCLSDNQAVNPYVLGIIGIPYPVESFVFNTERKNENPEKYGEYKQFIPFWSKQSGEKYWGRYIPPGNTNWLSMGRMVKAESKGLVLETKDNRNIHTAYLYQGINEFQKNFPKATASPALRNDIYCENFEFINGTEMLCHLGLFSSSIKEGKAGLSEQQSHTGGKSLIINDNISINFNTKSRAISSTNEPETAFPFLISPQNLSEAFTPQFGDYFLSCWVKIPELPFVKTYIETEIRIEINGQTAVVARPSGNIIEGWQQINAEFHIPQGNHQVRLHFQKPPGKRLYLDDIRIHPANAAMNAYVFCPKTLRLTAELDAWNYAVFLDYDEEGKPVRIRKESGTAIHTLQENRNGFNPNSL